MTLMSNMEVRRRTLIILGAAAAVSIALSAFALIERAEEGAPRYTPTEVLPGFASSVKNAALIQVVNHNGSFDVAYMPGKGWVLPGHGNYPADFEQVRHTLIGLAALETIAPKTDRADWLHYLSLDAPPKGMGIAFTMKNAQGAVLASLITGNTEELGDPNGTNGLFVRQPGSNQAWLARSVFTPQGDVSNWLPTQVLDLGAARIQQVTVTPADGPAYTLSHVHDGDPFTVVNPPKKLYPKKELIDNIPYAISSFSLTDVEPGTSMDFSKASHAVAKSFDGLVITIDLIKQGSDVWARMAVSAAPDAKPNIVQQASTLNAKVSGWAYKLPAEKGNALVSDLAAVMSGPAPPPLQVEYPPQQGR